VCYLHVVISSRILLAKHEYIYIYIYHLVFLAFIYRPTSLLAFTYSKYFGNVQSDHPLVLHNFNDLDTRILLKML